MIRLPLLWRRQHEVQQSGPHPRATGVRPPPAKSSKVDKKANGKPKRKRKRKPAVRAMRLADKVKAPNDAPAPEPT